MTCTEFTNLTPNELIGKWKIFIDEKSSFINKTPFIIIIKQFKYWNGFKRPDGTNDKSLMVFTGTVSYDINNIIKETIISLSSDFNFIKL